MAGRLLYRRALRTHASDVSAGGDGERDPVLCCSLIFALVLFTFDYYIRFLIMCLVLNLD